LFCRLQKGVWYCVAWSVVAGVGWPRGRGTLLTMPTSDVCQRYRTHQPPKRGCHLQFQVPTRCETRLSSQPPTIWIIFGCPKGALGRQRMWCTNPSGRARMAATFCRQPCSNIGVKDGNTITIRHASTIMCWTWAHRECGKKQKPWCLTLLTHAKSLCLKVMLLRGCRPSNT
jgi:hypothetical protein